MAVEATERAEKIIPDHVTSVVLAEAHVAHKPYQLLDIRVSPRIIVE